MECAEKISEVSSQEQSESGHDDSITQEFIEEGKYSSTEEAKNDMNLVEYLQHDHLYLFPHLRKSFPDEDNISDDSDCTSCVAEDKHLLQAADG